MVEIGQHALKDECINHPKTSLFICPFSKDLSDFLERQQSFLTSLNSLTSDGLPKRYYILCSGNKIIQKQHHGVYRWTPKQFEERLIDNIDNDRFISVSYSIPR